MSTRQSLLIADRYRLLQPLGEGGMGRVWWARDEVLRREVAIKELVPPAGLTPDERDDMQARSMREARAIARLSHPNVVRIYDVVGVSDGAPWIVMEYLPGESLDVAMADGSLPVPRLARIGLEILQALQAAHRLGVVHRDVKPSNILLAKDGRAVLTDFGIASVPGDPYVTRTGLWLGSPAYLAPERARPGTTSAASDLWSLGATLYAATEGKPPFARTNAVETLAALTTEPVPPPRHAGALTPILIGLLQKDPAERMDAATARRLLRRTLGPPGAAGRTGPVGSRPDPAVAQDGADLLAGTRALPTESVLAPERPTDGAAVKPAPPAPVADPASAADPEPASASAADPASASGPAPSTESAPERFAPGRARGPAGAAVGPAAPPAAPAPGAVPAREGVAAGDASEAAGDGSDGAAPESRVADSQAPESTASGPVAVPPRRPVPGGSAPPAPSWLRSPSWLRRHRLWPIAGLAALAVLAALVLVLVNRGDEPSQTPPPAGAPPASQAASPTAEQSEAESPRPDTVAASPGGFQLPDGWEMRDDGTGFEVPVPDGWEFGRDDDGRALWEDPSTGRLLLIDQTRDPQPDPLQDWQNNEQARRGGYADYQRVRLEEVSYWDSAADWEFTYTLGDTPVRVLNRNLITAPDQAYSIYWRTPAGTWEENRDDLQIVLDGFVPARS